MILVALVLLRHDPGSICRRSGFTHRRHALGLLVLGDAVRESARSLRRGCARHDLPRRPMSLLLASTYRRSATSRSGEAARSASTRPRRSTCFADARDDARVLPRHPAQGRARARRASCRTPPSRASGSSATRSSCRRWAPTACGYLPYLTALFFFIFFSNITEIIPCVQFPANARFGDAARARAAHVGDLQRRRRREAGPAALPEELDRSRRACRRRSCRSS